MSAETALDAAFRAQAAGDPAAELRFHERVLDAELLLLLATEAEGERLEPLVFDLDEGRFALAFDRDDRLAGFLEAPAPYAALPGRRLVEMLAGQGIGIGLNLGPAPSATLLPAAAVDWLAGLAEGAPVEIEARPRRLDAPLQAPAGLIAALDAKLAAMAAVIGEAWLVAADVDRATGLLLALVGVAPAAQAGVAAGIAEAVRFGGGTVLDVSFVDAGAPLDAVRRVGLRFELPRPTAPAAPRPPGRDPARPPILRR